MAGRSDRDDVVLAHDGADLVEREPLGADDDLFRDETSPAPTGGGRRSGLVVGAIVLALAVAMVWVVMAARDGGGLGQDPFGRAAPAFELPLLGDGEGGWQLPEGGGGDGDSSTLALADLKGSPIVLNFWGSWCGPCRDEAPILSAAEPRWRDDGVIFLGVDSKDARADGLAFEREFGIEYHSVVDADGSLGVEYGVFGYPETFFIDADGIIRAKQVGPIDGDTLETYIALIAG